MANRTLQSLIENLVSDEVDKALALSNKRRAEFRKQFAEVDTLHVKQPQLNLEADQPPPPPVPPAAPPAPVDPTAPPVPGAAPTAAGTAAAPAVGDPTAPATGMDPMAPGGAPGAPGGMPGGDPADPNATPEGGEDPLGGGAGGGSGFGGFGGGGGGGGGAGDEAGGPEDSGTEGDTGPEAPTGDPIQGMVDGAQELLNQTQDPALILKSLKGQIQTLFQNPDHALGLVKALYDTNDSVLQSVAQRLWLFLKAESPKK